ncbi:hypothetical protein [Listeria seeligeri]|uniref:hypothetical protein n=1 Tax=Listeria seeligeri TaxID=1640 RepID=UPI0022EA2863|nr:hypothetical protein [Listeria seeligeri]EHK2436580.1 hypothetical protein [Listeria monocytogenes]EIE7838053.1 hypothetical protein [Listeria monocytogenes]EIJ7591318.1 hypothetical protein [Listeria monocytogenes]EIO9132639.1 hypothetical protein [Listeria monocytogenes]EKS8447046.1 hypothetical protein [Listeria monocytogenes]
MSALVNLFIDSILDENSDRTIDDVPKSIRAKVQAGLDEYYAAQAEQQEIESAE